MELPEERAVLLHGATCVHCKYAMEADDVWMTIDELRGICLHCYGYQTGTLPRVFRRVIVDINTPEDTLKLISFGNENPWEYGIPGG